MVEMARKGFLFGSWVVAATARGPSYDDAALRVSVPLYPGSAEDASNWQVIFTKSLAVLFPGNGFFR
jgi:hypothetical protein